MDSTSIADLTRRLGIGPPSLYAAFGDKRALFLEVLNLYYDRLVQFLDQTLEVPGARRDAIAAMLLGIARFYSTPGLPRGCMVNTVAAPTGEPSCGRPCKSGCDARRARRPMPVNCREI